MSRRRNKRRPVEEDWVDKLLDVLLHVRTAVIAVIATAIALNHLGAIDWALDALLRGPIAEANSAYLHQSKVHLGESILVLTALNTGLEVLESSSAGISFIVDVEVQVGNIVATLQQLVERALAASLLSAGSLIGTELILKLGNILAAPILTLTLLIVGFHYLVRGHWRLMANISGQLADILVIFTLAVHIGLPLTIYGTSVASSLLTEPLAKQAHQRFVNTHADFTSGKHACEKEQNKCTEDTKKEKMTSHVKEVINRYRATSDDTHRKGRSLAGAVMRHTVAVLFDAFAFPLILLVFLLWISKVLTRHTLRVEEMIKAGDDAKPILPVYRKKRR